jgi:hypothetical protein
MMSIILKMCMMINMQNDGEESSRECPRELRLSAAARSRLTVQGVAGPWLAERAGGAIKEKDDAFHRKDSVGHGWE